MSRGVVLALFAVVGIFALIGGVFAPSRALSQESQATPTGELMPPCEDEGFDADVRPPERGDAAVTPVSVSIEATPGATPTIEVDDRELYLIVLTLQPGECIGYNAPSNLKDGAVVWTVQQGIVAFAWQEVIPGSLPEITRGDLAGNRDSISDKPDIKQTLYPGDWVTQDRFVAVSLRNVGSDSAVFLKAVYAKTVEDSHPERGCGGDCR